MLTIDKNSAEFLIMSLNDEVMDSFVDDDMLHCEDILPHESNSEDTKVDSNPKISKPSPTPPLSENITESDLGSGTVKASPLLSPRKDTKQSDKAVPESQSQRKKVRSSFFRIKRTKSEELKSNKQRPPQERSSSSFWELFDTGKKRFSSYREEQNAKRESTKKKLASMTQQERNECIVAIFERML